MRDTKSNTRISGNGQEVVQVKDRLWQELKDRKMKGYRFERDKTLGNMVIDFYSGILHFAILIDDPESTTNVLDKESQYDLEQMGIGFLRFTSEQLEKNFNYVLRNIQFWINNWEREYL